MKMLTFDEIKTGMMVIDLEGEFGIIEEIYDIHNVTVNKGYGKAIHCIDPNCEQCMYNPLYETKLVDKYKVETA